MAYTDMERRILDMWPKFEDGKYVMYEDEFDFDGEVKTAYGFNFGIGGRVSICSDKGSHVRLPNGERVKRPAPKVLDADGVEIKVGDTVWHEDGRELRVIGFDAMQDGETVLIVEYAAEPTKLGEVRCLSVTHVQPDSWERLEEDARQLDIDLGDTTDDYPRMSCCRDLIRRAKALAEKETAQ